jgi:endonuclease YncB( thermonuclease family)
MTPLFIAPTTLCSTDLESAIKARVSKVFDGDGFLAEVWHPIRKQWISRVPFRFAFIDAPEMAQLHGPESKTVLQKLILGKALDLLPIGKESTGGVPIDPYKRVLCMGFLTEEIEAGPIGYYHNGECASGTAKFSRTVTRNIEMEMIVNGWAWVVEQYTFEHEDLYFSAQEDAWRNKRGLWSVDEPEPPWKFKQREKRRKLRNLCSPDLFSG